MNIDFNQRIEQEVGNAIKEAVSETLAGYNSPLKPFIEQAVKKNAGAIVDMLNAAVSRAVDNPNFIATIDEAVSHRLAKLLVNKFDSVLEQEINKLKADPIQRAKITLGMNELINKIRSGK